MKVYGIGMEFVLSIKTCTRVTDFANDLGFSLCTVPSICYRVATSIKTKFKGVSSDKKYVI